MCLRGIQSRTLGSVEMIALYGVRCTFRVRAFHDIRNPHAAQIARIVKTPRSAVHTVRAPRSIGDAPAPEP
jgi:hypothetical protein